MWPPIGDLGQRRVAVARSPRRKPLVIQDACDELPNIGFIVDNENVTCHGSRPACQLPVAAWIFVSLLVVFACPLVSASPAFVSAARGSLWAASCLTSILVGLRP